VCVERVFLKHRDSAAYGGKSLRLQQRNTHYNKETLTAAKEHALMASLPTSLSPMSIPNCFTELKQQILSLQQFQGRLLRRSRTWPQDARYNPLYNCKLIGTLFATSMVHSSHDR
jgi:hypothetical protein